MSIFDGLFRSRDKPSNRTAGSGYTFYMGGSTAGKLVTERSAMQMTAVYACVRILSESIASLPVHLYQYESEGNKAKAVKHPLYRILHDEPNPEMTSFVFRETLMTHLLLWGNAYAQIIRNGKGEVIGLYPLMPNRMTVDRNSNSQIIYQYQIQDSDAHTGKTGSVTLKPSEVLHVPGLGFDGLVGYSPIAMAKNAIGLSIATEEYGARFFANGATPGGILEFPGTVKNPESIRESWNKGFSGNNAHKVAILEEGMKYTPISISPEQAQFLETRKFQIDEIARIFRVPPHMVGDLEKSSFSNIEQQSLEFVKYTLEPWIIRWEQSLNRALLSETEKPDYFVKFNVDGLLRGDYQSRMNGYAIARQNGWMSANDIRSLEQLDLIPDELGGNLYLINGNMTKLQDAGIFANKENNNEKVLEVEEPDGAGESGESKPKHSDPGKNPVPERHHR
ncbi:phage portal protein, HK97 family [Ruminobacter amylophilus]|uniref:Phage portal protein, HK97 family n=1 Tax=Ruminobacter amylophilus TaxID=867 RepID=A0A662ZK20_9GAMM|nr:phage portal protein [Ruminobacter amylophilus]SFP74783.1 phage portal protein, HK97 family [Ruminobacter amylophilus]